MPDHAAPAQLAPVHAGQSEQRKGLVYGTACYLIWGFFSLYLHLLSATSPLEIIAHRIIWSLLFCLVLLSLTRTWSQFAAVWRRPKMVAGFALAGLLITANWTIFVWGVNNGHGLDAALGYFINPLVAALLGVLVLGEKLRPAQWVAFGVGGAAVVVLVIGYGQVPWVALGLATSFGLYGLVKKKTSSVGPVPGLALETLTTVPLAIGYLGYLLATGHSALTSHSLGYDSLLVLLGPVTAIPLLMFAAATARIGLSTVGMLQYLAPVLQFLTSLFVFREAMPPARLLGFVIIWIAIAIFLGDTLIGLRRRQASAARELRAAVLASTTE